MPLDTTVGGATANSYISIAEADAFAGDRLGSEAATWLGASTTSAVKEKALKQATADIDARARVGEAWADTQTLRFPRVVDIDSLDVIFVPSKVKEATFWQAAYLNANATVMDEANTRRARGLLAFTEQEVSGTVALDPEFGMFSRKAEELLESVVASRSGFLGTIPIRSHGQTSIPDVAEDLT